MSFSIDPLSGFMGFVQTLVQGTMASEDRKQRQAMFDKNFGLATQQFEHEKAIQQKIFDREDNAVQRKVADLKAAGINPMLAAGSPAHAGAHVPVHAPQHEYAGKENELAVVAAAMNLMKMSADISISREERNRLRLENEYNRRTLDTRVSRAKTEADAALLDYTWESESYKERLREVIVDNNYTEMDTEATRLRARLYERQGDNVAVETAIKNIELQVERELHAMRVQVTAAQAQLIALEVANRVAIRDDKSFERMKTISSGSTLERIRATANNLIGELIEERKRRSAEKKEQRERRKAGKY